MLTLQVSNAFHSPLMLGAMGAWQKIVDKLELRRPSIPVALNTTGEVTESLESIRVDLVDQLVETVRWCDCITSLAQAGARDFIEVGDSKALAALNRAIEPGLRTYTLADPMAVARVEALRPPSIRMAEYA